MNRYKIAEIVEYIMSSGEPLPYDMDDVAEGMQDILKEYAIYSILTEEEYYQLLDELLEMAERSEIAEAVRWASRHLVCGKDRQGTDFRIPNIWA